MSFCQDVKNELCRVELKKECCRQAFLYGVLLFSRTFLRDGIVFTTENRAAARKFSAELSGGYGTFVSISTDYRRVKGEITAFYTVSVEDTYQRELLREKFSLDQEILSPVILERRCCIEAFFRGLFLLYGTMSNPEKEYHLEISAPNSFLAEELAALGSSLGFDLRPTLRKGNALVYLKDSEQIEDFLTFTGDGRSALRIMDIKVIKDVRNKINRETNCETANLKKTVKASEAIVKDIRFILEKTGIEYLDEELRPLALLRVENPELSLKELSELSDPPLSRSGVNHRLKRIAAAAEKLRQK